MRWTRITSTSSVTTGLTVKADPRSPATGDTRHTALWAALTGLTAMGMGAAVLIKKRRYYGRH
ncbi:MAG: LPXTG cell wall anchor domain-containing protein [Oscillospiraceae bacterium]|nr:LPXTG cell wall anchor domain-containing protein [Oscillospiraceae bacterium]